MMMNWLERMILLLEEQDRFFTSLLSKGSLGWEGIDLKRISLRSEPEDGKEEEEEERKKKKVREIIASLLCWTNRMG